eukprot:jgi/Mesvir1/1781/Mv08178-RA.1
MRLPRRGARFTRITHHAQVTQCLGCLGDKPWYVGVCPPGTLPSPDNLRAFRVPAGVFVKLHVGTWHAGPLFDGVDHMDFYNLELADTNVVDHTNHDFAKDGYVFEISGV